MTGEGVAEFSPDQCVVRVDFNVLGESASGALDRLSELASAAIERLKEQGIRTEDITTLNVSVSPFFDRDKERVTAHVGKYQMAVKVRLLDDVGGVVAALTEVGGDHLQLQGLQLVHSDERRLSSDARRDAVADANDRAKTIAEAAGIHLGQILHITDEPSEGRWRAVRNVGFGHAATSLTNMPIEGGSGQVSARVTITYEIEN